MTFSDEYGGGLLKDETGVTSHKYYKPVEALSAFNGEDAGSIAAEESEPEKNWRLRVKKVGSSEFELGQVAISIR